MLNHISLERAAQQHSDKLVGFVQLGWELSYECNTGVILYEYYHILVHICLDIAPIQITQSVLECWQPALANGMQFNTPVGASSVYKYTHAIA